MVRPRLEASRRAVRIGAVVALAVLASACNRSSGPETTGSIGRTESSGSLSLPGFGRKPSNVVSRRDVEALGERYTTDPGDVALALRYAQALRATSQRSQAVAVLQQIALRNPKNTAVLAAYGKSLAEAGRFAEAADVLQNAHTAAQPDWRVLSAQGAVADQLGDHARAQGLYEAALKIQPDDPVILSNLGLSYALAKRLDAAEATLQRAAAQPRADARVRQNLALVYGLQGKFSDAEAVSRQDLSPDEAAANTAALRAVVAQPNAWKAIKASDAKAKPAGKPAGRG